jgi:hypothetical protein
MEAHQENLTQCGDMSIVTSGKQSYSLLGHFQLRHTKRKDNNNEKFFFFCFFFDKGTED